VAFTTLQILGRRPLPTLLAVLAVLSPSAVGAGDPAVPACFAFRDVTGSAGLAFAPTSTHSEAHHLPETMGSGAAWLDADGDGWLDLYVVQAGDFPPNAHRTAADRLFRNRGDGTFVDATSRAGSVEGYGQGVVAADAEGDGDVDLFVASVGHNALLLNRGDGAFTEGTDAAGLAGGGWSSSAAFADADGDGDLDLYVARYVAFDPQRGLFCGDFESGRRDYCNPTLFDGAADLFYRNRGNGTFEDASAAAGLAGPALRGLGVVFVDLDGDLRPEIYVANDMHPNLLFHNLGSGRFEEVSLISGAAVDSDGHEQAGMGIAVGDVDGDGKPELAVTNFDAELNSLYRNLGGLQFDDVSARSGFGPPSYNLLGFGIAFADYDRDGDLDAFVANGHVLEHPERGGSSPLQPPLLLAGDGAGHFQRCADPTMPPRLSRGLATADYDNDGDPDVLVTDNDGSAQLWSAESAGGWLGVRLEGTAPNTGGVGAVVTLGRQRRWVLAGDSYQSSSDGRALFGVTGANVESVADLEVVWRDGRRQRFVRPPLGRYLVVAPPAGSSRAVP
jgi:enediyne biosynthesis protein E4